MPDPLTVSLGLPADPLSVAAARHMVRTLDAFVPDEQLQRAELIISELVTNAVRHGSRPGETIRVELATVDGQLRGCVTDNGPAFEPPVRVPEEGATGGFGLHIVQRLATAWQIDRLDAGNAVRFTL
jgi:anti-sigma regulatory factor (Ser/Thr protein kinase)